MLNHDFSFDDKKMIANSQFLVIIITIIIFCFKMGAEIGALAISHLEEVSEEGMRAMARAGTVGVLLPTTAFNLRLKPPPARALIQEGVPVALGSDFNPNAHCLAMVIPLLIAVYL